MNMIVAEKPIHIPPKGLYLEPISACNLHCKMCYANVINGPGRRIIEADKVLNFVQRFLAITPSQVWIYWCGTGEIFLHRDFPKMVNRLLAEYSEDVVTQTIQTNGTVQRLREFDSLQRLDFSVSIDGLRQFHEWHRGKNTYNRTLDFCREALDRGCRLLAVRMLLTRDNIEYLDEFRAELSERIGPRVELLLTVPYTNKDLRGVHTKALAISQRKIEDAIAITRAEALRILEQKYQNRYVLNEDPTAVDNYISLTTYGVFSCCEGVINLGDLNTDMVTLLERYAASEGECRSCPMFPCI
jgi:MoaA/NifB/PqqE/SkfB family radical SAM enzyme